MKQFSFIDAVENMIDDINVAKNKSKKIHKSGDVRGSGDQIEILIRDIISEFLPEKYLVREGHIIDELGNVSNQFDIIIFDRLNTPKFFETTSKSVYYPIESVLAVGEIKKTLKPLHSVEFADKLLHLKQNLKRQLFENTAYGGYNPSTDIRDALNLDHNQKYRNPLYSFIFAIDGKIDTVQTGEPFEFFANDVVILNDGYMTPGTMQNGILKPLMYDDAEEIESLFIIKSEDKDHLSRFLDRLITHLNRCYTRPFSITKYLTKGQRLTVHSDQITIRNLKK